VQTFKRYLMIQGMMFVFGIVGPILLIALRLAKASDAKVKIDHRRPTDSVVICWSG
jgi:hypothetical protein